MNGNLTPKHHPRRRRYQDAKFSTLLHLPTGKQPDPRPIDQKSEVNENNHLSSFTTRGLIDQSHIVASEDKSVVGRSDSSHVDKRKKNETKDLIENDSNDKSDSPFCEKRYHSKLKNGQSLKNPLFDKYLYIDGRNGASGSNDANGGNKKQSLFQDNVLYNRQTAAEKGRTTRKERRHTATGVGGLSLKDIENWICENKQYVQGSKDDSEVLIAKTKIVEMKRAHTVRYLEYQEKRNTESKKEKSNLTQKSSYEAAKVISNSSFSSLLLNGTNTKPAVRKDTAINHKKDQVTVSEDNIVTETSSIEKNQQGKEINNRLNCFLTPRPYRKRATPTSNSMSRSWRSWRSNEITIKEDEELQSPWINGYSETLADNRQNSLDLYSTCIPDDDDDFLLPSSRSQSPPRAHTKYDTFLDLSKLDFDDDGDSSSISSCDTQPLSLSDFEATLSKELKSDPRHQINEQSKQEELLYGNSNEEFGISQIEEMFNEINENQTDENDSASFRSESLTNYAVNESRETEKTVLLQDNELQKSIATITFENAIEPSSMNQLKEKFPRAVNTDNETYGIELLNQQSNSASSTNSVTEDSLSNETKEATDNLLSSDGLTSTTSTTSLTETTISSTTSSSDSSETDGNSNDEITTYVCDDEISEDSLNTVAIINKTASLDRSVFRKNGSKNSLASPSTNCETKSLSQNVLSPNAGHNIQHDGIKRLFQMVLSTVENNSNSDAKIQDLLDLIAAKGIQLFDPRLRNISERIEKEKEGKRSSLNIEVMSRICEPCYKFVRTLLLSQVAIPGFKLFKLRMSRIFQAVQQLLKKESDRLPTIDPYSNFNVLMRTLRKEEVTLSMSICTVDGQRCSFGDTETPHPLNTCSSVFNYCLACRQNGIETLSHFLENKVDPINKTEFVLQGKEVFNPFTKAGSILTSSLLFRELTVQSKLHALHEFYRALIGNEPLCCDNLSYNYKRIYDHEEIGLAYYLSASQRLPRGTSADLPDFLNFHFQAKSSAMTSDACAIAAATLANGGICPITGDVVVDESFTKQTISTMRLYNNIFTTAPNTQNSSIATVSSDEGSILILIPGVLGIACFLQCQSPELIQEVVEAIVKDLQTNFNFEIYRSLKEKQGLEADKR